VIVRELGGGAKIVDIAVNDGLVLLNSYEIG
jgi:hypothetical protein